MITKYHKDRGYVHKLLRYCMVRWQKADRESRRHSSAWQRKHKGRADHYFAACDRAARLARMAE